jgi:hypothetical protein
MLALSILKELNINKNCLYISTQISPNQLFQYHPWIGNFFDQPKVTELTEIPENGMNHHMFVDARLDEPSHFLMQYRLPIIFKSSCLNDKTWIISMEVDLPKEDIIAVGIDA